LIQKLKVDFQESAKERDALIEAGCQLSGSDADDAQQNVDSICLRYVKVQSADFIRDALLLMLLCLLFLVLSYLFYAWVSECWFFIFFILCIYFSE